MGNACRSAGTDPRSPRASLFTLAKGIVPGLDAVREGCQVSSGLYVVGALLAGFGVQALIEGRALARHLVTAILVVAVLLEAFLPPLSRATFGRAVDFMPQLSRPPEAVLALYERAPDGAFLDVPANASVLSMADYVFRSAYHGHPVAACYGAFDSPLWSDVAQLATRLQTDPGTAIALHALGIRTVVVHYDVRNAKRRAVSLEPGPHLVPLGSAGLVTLYRFESTSEVVASTGTASGATIASPSRWWRSQRPFFPAPSSTYDRQRRVADRIGIPAVMAA